MIKNINFNERSTDWKNIYEQLKNKNDFENSINYVKLNAHLEDKSVLFNNEKSLIKAAKLMLEIHESKLPVGKNKLAWAIKKYRMIFNQLGYKIEVLDKYFKRINTILSKSNNTRITNLFWFNSNLIEDNDQIKLNDSQFLMNGDKHFDLASFIVLNNLNDKEEKIFLDSYNTYWEEYLIQQKILVAYFYLLYFNTANCQKYNDYLINIIESNIKLFDYKRATNTFRREEW
ncbi:hypothetical protein [Mycoplasmopsis iners]|uniref:hypothetical protein n=1 Tax=Mycoplasmopsis iners TaxID=76630 RepID=UPI0006922FB2|nr:hypothetical protein [Mycoplasmopsis iners]